MMESFAFAVLFLLPCFSFADETSTLPFPVFRIKEIKFVGGVAGATSYYSDHWRPENGFLPTMPLDNGWHIGPGNPGPARPPPVMIWYDFKNDGIRPSEVSFMPAQKGGGVQGKAPTSYQFVGSNDATCNNDSTWTVLCEDLSDQAWRNEWEVRYCKVKLEVTEKFRCLGIRVLKNRRSDGWTAIRNIRMWRRIETRVKDML